MAMRAGPDELAINSAGTLLWVTGASNGTVTAYAINSLDRAAHQEKLDRRIQHSVRHRGASDTGRVYVSDTGTGLIQPMSYNTTTGALAKNFTAMPVRTRTRICRPRSRSMRGSIRCSSRIRDSARSHRLRSTRDGSLTQGPALANISTSTVPVGIGIAS